MATTGRARQTFTLLGWLLALTGIIVGFHALGSGSLAAPPLRPEGWSAWSQDRDPLVATVAALRLIVVGLAWYLLAVTLLGMVARLLRAARLIAIADAITIPALRGFLRNTVGVSLATAMIVTTPVAAGLGARAYAAAPTHVIDVLPVQHPTGEGGGNDATTAGDLGVTDRGEAALPPGSSHHTGPVLRGIDEPLPLEIASEPEVLVHGFLEPAPHVGLSPDDEPDAGHVEVSGADPDVVSAVERPNETSDDATTARRTATVVSGDSLWSIAREALSDATGAVPSDAEVAAYWQEVIERNRAQLADPDNPDLIFPGDTIVLPDLPTAAETGP